MSQRAGLRFLNTFRQSALRKTFTQTQKRTFAEATDNVAAAPAQSKLAGLWNSPVGPKTVHFWCVCFCFHHGGAQSSMLIMNRAPIMKVC